MPKKQKEALERAGRKKGFKGERLKRFIHGTLTNIEKKKRRKEK